MITHDHTWIWDSGPPKPAEPAEPPVPAGAEGDPAYARAAEEFHYQLHMARFRHLIDDYAKAYHAYVELKKSFDAFGGKARRVEMWTNDAKNAIERDPTRYSRMPPK